MPSKRKESDPQQKLKQTHQLRNWVVIGGLSSFGMGVLNILSLGYVEPYDGGQIILGMACLGYSLKISKKISQLRIECQLQNQR